MFYNSSIDMSWTSALFGALVLYYVGLGFYRLFISPLASIPGPKLAALTQWYETYYELWSKPTVGQFMFHYRELHKKYGPIIRLNPNEVHIQDSQFYHVFFAQTRPWDKPKYLQHRFSNDNGLFPTPSHDVHRHRRAALNPFFSKRKISEFAPLLQAQSAKLCERLRREYQGTGKVLRLDWLFASYVADTVIGYCFENKYNWLEAEDFHCGFAEAMNSLLDDVHLVTQFPWLARLLNALPKSLLAKLNPNMKIVHDFNLEMRKQIDGIIADHQLEKTSRINPKDRQSVFKALLSSSLPPQELSALRLQHEATTIIGAGVETTRWALAVGSFHIINDQAIFNKLREELTRAIPDPDHMPSLERLEQLPYLNACVQESCRLSYGTSQRGHRISDHITLQYGSYIIPPGTTISMDNYAVSHDENIFPDSHAFKPERWLDGPTAAPDGKPLSSYMVSFGRGTRQCIGMPLALAEMYILMANLYRNFEFDLFDTDRSAVDCASDAFAPRPKAGTQGVRVYVR